jgi:glucuronoarabinoxylan endo-1,4-beta-xylanase
MAPACGGSAILASYQGGVPQMAIQKNTAAWGYVSIFANHQYGLGPTKPEPAIASAGKDYWQTEVDTGTTSDDPTGDNMPSALKLAGTIHDDLTKGNLNAFHYWWLYAGGSSGLFDTNTKVWTKRFWIMGNFSRFVRPGFMRVTTSGTAPSGVQVSAYTHQADGTVAIVAINNNASATQLPLFISGIVPCTMTPWVTSATDSIVSKSPITVSSARFSVSLEAKSVTTLVGTP